LILGNIALQESIEEWKKTLPEKAGFDDISQFVEKVIELAVEQAKSKTTPTDEDKKKLFDLSKNVLVYPFPRDARARHEQYEGSRIVGPVVELTLGDEVFLTGDDVPRTLSEAKSRAANPWVKIEPGEFAVLTTYEYVFLPIDIMGLISIKNTYKQKGLISVSGFHVDPGYRGRLTFTAYNAGPSDLLFRFRERLFMITFTKIEKNDWWYWAPAGLRIPTDTISHLQGMSVSPRSLDKRLKRLETIINVLLVPLILALIIALIEVAIR
jgi:dCTP deaminase